MGIFLKKRGDGYDPRWHGSWMVDGVRKTVALNLWHGTPPGPGEKEGDAVFERSRGEAEQRFKAAREGKRSAEEEMVIAQKVYAARYGRKIQPVKIAELRTRWDALPLRAGEERRKRVHSILRRFEDFMAGRFPGVKECADLSVEHFKTFLAEVDRHGIGKPKNPEEEEESGGVSARTWNDVVFTLRSVLGKVDGQGPGFRDYLAKLPLRDETIIHRRPFTGAELEAIFAAAGEVDPELRPVIIAAAYTALRRGDVASLKWESVDMEGGFVTVKTAKTGETVEIPILAPFMDVLRDAERARREGVPYVFPGVARAYHEERNSLDRRLKRVLRAAGFVRPERSGKGGRYPAPTSPADAVAKVDAGMRSARWTEQRRQKGLAILQRHLRGEKGRAIAAAMGIARGAVSAYLHEMEEAGQVALVSSPKTDTPQKPTLAPLRDGEQRKNRGSLCGWHSFRTTFCTLALGAGIPMELLRRITGHRTAEIVEKYYNQAKREQARRAFGAVLPQAAAIGPGRAALPSGESAAGEAFEAVPAEVAKLARMLAGADKKTLAKVAAMLKKGGGK